LSREAVRVLRRHAAEFSAARHRIQKPFATVEAEEQGVVQAERVVKGANPRSAYWRASALVLSIDAWRPSMMTACPVGS
jgi:hypothetical protein